MLTRVEMDAVYVACYNYVTCIQELAAIQLRDVLVVRGKFSGFFLRAFEHLREQAEFPHGWRAHQQNPGRSKVHAKARTLDESDKHTDTLRNVKGRDRKPFLQIVGPQHQDHE